MNRSGVKLCLQRLGLFTVGTIVLLSCGARSQVIESEIKGFKHAFVDPASGRRTSLLSGLSATNISNEALLVIQPQLQLFSEDERTNLTIASPQCTYNTQAKLVSSAEKLHAASADGRFSLEGDGFRYHIATASLVVSNQAHAIIRKDSFGPDSPAAPAARAAVRPPMRTNTPPAAGELLHIYSDHLRYQTNVAVFEDNVRVTDPQGGLTCGLLTVKFTEPARSDERRQIEQILAEQSVVIDSEELHATGERATYQQTTDVIGLTGNPRWRIRQYEGRAEELIVNRGTRDVHAARSVEITLPAGSIGRSGFLPPANPTATNAPNRQPAQVRADDFVFMSDAADTNFNLALFHGNVLVTGGNGNLSCESMTLRMSAPSNLTESVVAERSVVMEREDRRVTGDKAVYTAATDTVDVSGQPSWKAGRLEGTAAQLSFDLTNGVYRAMRSVRMQLPAGSLGRSAWLFPTNRFEAGKASHPPLGSLGPDSLGRETSGQAAGTVVPLPAAPAPSPVKPVEISCDEFEFQPAPTGGKTDTAIYRGHVVVSDPGGTKLSSERLTAKMLPGTNQVESVVAERNVDIEIHEPLGERRAHGDKAVYTAANAELELTGADGVEIAFIDPKIEGRGTGAKGVYSGATDTLELVGNSVVTTQFGQVSGDVVALNRANTTLKATGDWRLKLNPAALKKSGPTSVPDL